MIGPAPRISGQANKAQEDYELNQIKWVVAVGVLAAALALAVACGDNDNDEGHTPAPAVAQQAAPAPEPRTTQVTQQVSGQQSGIWVSGVGKLSVEPDLVDFRVGVETMGETVAEANGKASDAMAAIVGALKASGIEDKDIRTSRFNIRPEYDYRETTLDGVRTGSQVLVGYNVRNTVAVKVRDLDGLPKLVDDVVAAGGDNIRIDSVEFTVEDPDARTEELRELAVADAAAKAAHVAELAGVSLGDLTYLGESGAPSVPAPYAAPAAFAMEARASAAPSFSAGEIELSLTVQASFAIE